MPAFPNKLIEQKKDNNDKVISEVWETPWGTLTFDFIKNVSSLNKETEYK
jgi:hypothetical protein